MTVTRDSASDATSDDDRLDTAARSWAAALSGHGFVPLSATELRSLLRGLTARLRRGLHPGGGDDPDTLGHDLGSALVSAHITDAAALGASMRVLRETFGDGDRLARVLAAMATGYAGSLREQTLAEQETLGRAIISAQAEAERAARESEARFRAIFAGAAIGIGIADVSGRIIEVNQAMADLLGYTAAEMCQHTVTDLVHPDDPPDSWDQYHQLNSGTLDHLRLEKTYARKDGDPVRVDLAVTLIRDSAGEPRYTLAMMDDITDRYRLQERLVHQAHHDPLTGLPNRVLFSERLAGALATGAPTDRVGVCYLDLDGFKHINDSLGHDIGDQLLVEVARRVDACAGGDGHLAARMGGDEFVLLVERSTGADQMIGLARQTLDALSTPLAVGPHQLRVSASVGVVEQPTGTTVAETMKAADVSLYWAKADGRGRWAWYDPDRVADEVTRFELSAALPHALDRREFVLVYQPIITLHDGRMRGVEALVRWRHPRLGLLTPDRFIGLAEETGLIVPLGRFVLEEACRQAMDWLTDFPGERPFMSVNLAAAQTQEPGLVDDVARILDRTGLEPGLLQLELTESAAMATAGAPLDALRQLADGGVRVAIDDFGTGYSNLAYLHSLPVHTLKLAGPFIEGLREPDRRDGHDERIVDALIRLAHAIDLTVTAENVETREQADRLRALGCDAAQGWYVARPQNAQDVGRFIAAR